MPKGIYQMPFPENEPVNNYVKGSPQRESLLEKYNHMYTQDPIHVPLYIGDKEVTTEDKLPMSPPHDHQHVLGHFSMGSKKHVQDAISAALAARKEWSSMAWENRATIFLKAADLLAGPYRDEMNAATMLGQ